MKDLKNILMQFAKDTKGLKKATNVEIDEENGSIFFQFKDGEVEQNPIRIMKWMTKKIKGSAAPFSYGVGNGFLNCSDDGCSM